MSDVVIKVENLSKQYRLGTVGTGTLSHDLNRFWAKLRGKEDPYLKIGQANDRTKRGDSDYVWALKDINFEVRRGEVLGIIGRNGAGKSTLLKILSQITRPTTGSVKMKGRVGSLLEVGTGFHPELTGRENIYINGAILGMRRWEIDKKLDEIIDFAGVERYIDTPVKRYSSGMMVRLGFSVAAHLEPEILIVDEVLAVGDAEFQNKAVKRMQGISDKSGCTLIFVSHDLNRIAQLTQRCILLDNGKLSLDASTGSAIEEYSDHKAPNYYKSEENCRKNFIKSVEIASGKMEVYNELAIKISLEIKEKIVNAALSIQVQNAKGINVLHFLILNNEQKFADEVGTWKIRLIVSSSSLYPGSYRLNVFLGDNANKVNLDKVLDICPFEIVVPEKLFRDYYWYPDQATFLEKCEWEICHGE